MRRRAIKVRNGKIKYNIFANTFLYNFNPDFGITKTVQGQRLRSGSPPVMNCNVFGKNQPGPDCDPWPLVLNPRMLDFAIPGVRREVVNCPTR